MIYGSKLAVVGTSGSLVLLLCRCGPGVVLAGEGLLFGSWSRADSAAAAVIAYMRDVGDHGLLVHVVERRRVHVIHSAVVEKVAAVPISAGVPRAGVAEPVVDTAVEPDLRAPIASVPEIRSAGPTPIARRPQHTNLRRFHPGAGNPEVPTIVRVTPIAWSPEITFLRASGLHVNGQHGRGNGNGENDLGRSRGTCARNQKQDGRQRKPAQSSERLERSPGMNSLHFASPRKIGV